MTFPHSIFLNWSFSTPTAPNSILLYYNTLFQSVCTSFAVYIRVFTSLLASTFYK